jgi:hypothetical protein
VKVDDEMQVECTSFLFETREFSLDGGELGLSLRVSVSWGVCVADRDGVKWDSNAVGTPKASLRELGFAMRQEARSGSEGLPEWILDANSPESLWSFSL